MLAKAHRMATIDHILWTLRGLFWIKPKNTWMAMTDSKGKSRLEPGLESL